MSSQGNGLAEIQTGRKFAPGACVLGHQSSKIQALAMRGKSVQTPVN